MSAFDDVVPAALAGERIDRVIAMIAGCSRSEATLLVAEGDVRVNGDVVLVRAHRVAESDRVQFDWQTPEATPLTGDSEVDFRVVHEDSDVIVIDKPAGLVVHPGAGNDTGTLVQGLLARFPEIAEVGAMSRPGIVHRLDKETSGLLMVARSQRSYDSLAEQLSQRSVSRRYLALVWEAPDTKAGVVDAPIGRSARVPTKMAVTEQGRSAITGYELLKVYTDPVTVALLECTLETGRTHQIRVHLEAIGHPVVGDDRYHGARQKFAVSRMFLHAVRLGFTHPESGERLDFESSLPDALQEILGRLS